MGAPTNPGNRSTPPRRGRPFGMGNPGRPRGSKNRATLIAQALPEDWQVNVLRAAYETARAGDPQLLKFFVSRLMPRERLVNVDLPTMEYADDLVEAMAAILRAIAEGSITPTEGAAMAAVINAQTRAIDVADVVKRLDTIEAIVRERRHESTTAQDRTPRTSGGIGY
jgi:hypothetical protein